MNQQGWECPKCGTPVYAPGMWHGITPPPSTPSCGCAGYQQTTETGTTIRLNTNHGRRSTDRVAP